MLPKSAPDRPNLAPCAHRAEPFLLTVCVGKPCMPKLLQMASEAWYGSVSEQSSQQSTTMPWRPPTPVQHPWTDGSTTAPGIAANANHASGRWAHLFLPSLTCYSRHCKLVPVNVSRHRSAALLTPKCHASLACSKKDGRLFRQLQIGCKG